MDKFLCKINSHKEGFLRSFGPDRSKTSKKDPLEEVFLACIGPLIPRKCNLELLKPRRSFLNV